MHKRYRFYHVSWLRHYRNVLIFTNILLLLEYFRVYFSYNFAALLPETTTNLIASGSVVLALILLYFYFVSFISLVQMTYNTTLKPMVKLILGATMVSLLGLYLIFYTTNRSDTWILCTASNLGRIIILAALINLHTFGMKETTDKRTSLITFARYYLVTMSLTIVFHLAYAFASIPTVYGDIFALFYYFAINNFVVFYPQRFLQLINADTNETAMQTFYELCAKFGLSSREQEIVQLILDGKSNKEISDIACISVQTAKTHTSRIYKKANVQSRVQLVNLFKK